MTHRPFALALLLSFCACGPSSMMVVPRTIGTTVAELDPDGEPWDVTSVQLRTATRVSLMAMGAPPLSSFATDAALAHGGEPSAPDPVIALYADGELVCTGKVVRDSHRASWQRASLTCRPFLLEADTRWRITFTDADLFCDDPIAECTAVGIPELADDGSVAPGTFDCNGEVTHVAIRLEPLSDERAHALCAEQPRLRARKGRGAFCPKLEHRAPVAPTTLSASR